MTALDKLLALHPFDFSTKATALRKESLSLNFKHQLDSFPEYLRYVKKRQSLLNYPPLYLPLLKERSFQIPTSLKIVQTITSSGTNGHPTHIPLGEKDLFYRILAVQKSYLGMNLIPHKAHATVFLIPPTHTKMAGTVVMHQALLQHPQIKQLTFAVEMDEQGFHLKKELIQKLTKESLDNIPSLIVGYPALIAKAISECKKRGIPKIPLSPQSVVLTGGGWKSFLPNVTVSYKEFKKEVSAFFQIPLKNIRDMFGLSESPVIFVECEKGFYHVPNFCHLYAYDPLQPATPLSSGEGLMLIQSPLSSSYPLMSILTTDKIQLFKNCSCSLSSPCFRPLGRVSFAHYTTCAMNIASKITEEKR